MRAALLPLSWAYRTAALVREKLFRSRILTSTESPLPAISIGNLGFGGTEKTPLAMHLLKHLQESGLRPALVSRGFRGKWERCGGILSDGHELKGGWREGGDEPYMIARNFPQAGILVGRDRAASCKRAAELGFDIVVLDDAFQHLRLKRNCNIVLHDPGEKILLREFSHALKRADVILIKADLPAAIGRSLRQRFPQAEVFTYRVVSRGWVSLHSGDIVPARSLQGKPLLGFCGIARPARFLSRLRQEQLEPVRLLRFPDHHPYPRSSFAKIRDAYAALSAEAAVTTEKDAVKISEISQLRDLPIFYLKIDLEISEEFYRRLTGCMHQTARI